MAKMTRIFWTKLGNSDHSGFWSQGTNRACLGWMTQKSLITIYSQDTHSRYYRWRENCLTALIFKSLINLNHGLGIRLAQANNISIAPVKHLHYWYSKGAIHKLIWNFRIPKKNDFVLSKVCNLMCEIGQRKVCSNLDRIFLQKILRNAFSWCFIFSSFIRDYFLTFHSYGILICEVIVVN